MTSQNTPLKHRRTTRILLRCTGPLLAIYLISRLDFNKVWLYMQSLHYEYLLLAIGASLPVWMIKTLKWKVINEFLDIKTDFRRLLIATIAVDHISALSPAKIGEAVKMTYLRKDASMVRLLSTLVIDRLTEGITLLVLGLAALLFLVGEEKTTFDLAAVTSTALALACSVIVFLAIRVLPVREWLTRIEKKSKTAGFRARLMSWIVEMLQAIQQLDARDYLVLLLCSLLVWSTTYVRAILLAQCIGLDLTWLILAALVTAATILQLLPISIMGIGSRDVLFVVVLGQMGVPQEVSLSYSFLFVVLRLVELLFSYIAWLVWPPDEFA